MKGEILYTGSNAALSVELEAGETLKSESGAMVTMTPNVDVSANIEGGLLGGLSRKLLTGESLFFQKLKAENGNGSVMLAPRYYGDITEINLNGSETFSIQKEGFLAASEKVELTTKMQNLAKGLFSGEGFFIMKASGVGSVYVSSRGAIHKLELAAGEERIIDNQHLVAWNETMEYKIEKASKGILASVTSGEFLVTRFTGPGTVYIQTRNRGAILGDIPKTR